MLTDDERQLLRLAADNPVLICREEYRSDFPRGKYEPEKVLTGACRIAIRLISKGLLGVPRNDRNEPINDPGHMHFNITEAGRKAIAD